MFTNELSTDLAFDLYNDENIADYDIRLAGTNDEVALLTSHSGKIAELVDDAGVISYGIYSSDKARRYGLHDHIGAIGNDADRAEFLALFK